MSFMRLVRSWLFMKRPRSFTLGQRKKPGIPGARADVVDGQPVGGAPPVDQASGSKPLDEREDLTFSLHKSLEGNLKVIQRVFHIPRNSDLVIRRLGIRAKKTTVPAAIVYIEGMVEIEAVRDHLIRPLLQINTHGDSVPIEPHTISHLIITEASVGEVSSFAEVVAAIVSGHSVILIDGETVGISADTKSIEHRQVQESPTEAVVRGPHEGFVENFRTNSARIRSYLATPDLVCEVFYVGTRSRTPAAMFYLEGVANPKLLSEVRRRLKAIQYSAVVSSASLIEFITDTPIDPFPTFIATERPDRTASMLEEGHIAIVSDTPTALLLPATVWGLMHSAEDYYISPISATLLRTVRWFALFVTIYSSALYVAVVTFHPEMIPTELMLAIASSREAVPFPTLVEVLLMEVTFELIREAGIRTPMVIGPTIGIVGAVILGQAAVQASIVSPVLVVVVAVSGLGSFGIPNYSLGLYARLLRFAMVLIASSFGIPGLTLATLILLAKMVGTTSLGVPVTAPLVPTWSRSDDLIARSAVYKQKTRPAFLRPLDRIRAGKQARALPEPDSEGGQTTS